MGLEGFPEMACQAMLKLSRTAHAAVQGCRRPVHCLHATHMVPREYSSWQHRAERHPVPNVSNVPRRRGPGL